MKTISKLVLLLISALSVGQSFAQSNPEASPIPKISNEWRYEVTPYLWAPGIKGTINFDNRLTKSADMSSSNVLGNLKTGGMIAGEAH